MDQELITQACPLHFGPNTVCRICFVLFFQVHINNLLSFVCDFPRGGGENLENSEYVALIAFIIRLTPLHSATKAAD